MELREELLGYALAQLLAQGLAEVDEGKLLEQRSYQMLCEIKAILDDTSLTDESCFEKIERIVCVFENAGCRTSRHDFG